MNIQEQTKKIEQFHAEGKSIRRIAKELGISKSNVHRIISESGTPTRDSPVPPSQQACPNIERDNKNNNFSTNESKNNTKPNTIMDSQDMLEIEMKRLELEHEIQMRKFEMQEEELKLRKMEIESRSKGDTTLIEKQKQDERLLLWELSDFFNGELSICNSKGIVSIPIDEMEVKLDLIKELKQKLGKYCAKYALNSQDMPHYIGLEKMIPTFKTYIDDFEAKNDNEDDGDDENEDDEEIEYLYDKETLSILRQLSKNNLSLVFKIEDTIYSKYNYKGRY
jgi:hypothetical protein